MASTTHLDFDLDVTRALRRSLGVLRQDPGGVVLICLAALLGTLAASLPGTVLSSVVNLLTGSWAGMLFSFVGMMVLLVNCVLTTIAWTLLHAGVYRYILKRLRGEEANFSEITAGFQRERVFPLAMLGGVLGLALTIGVMLCFLPSLYVAMVSMFALPLVADRNKGAWSAILDSAQMVHRNWVTGAAILLVVLGLAVLGILTLFVGFLVTLPLIWGVVLAAYEDAYANAPKPAAREKAEDVATI